MSETAIHIENLTVGFGAKTVIDNLSLDVRRGETLGLIGASVASPRTMARANSSPPRPPMRGRRLPSISRRRGVTARASTADATVRGVRKKWLSWVL